MIPLVGFNVGRGLHHTKSTQAQFNKPRAVQIADAQEEILSAGLNIFSENRIYTAALRIKGMRQAPRFQCDRV